ncbi:hypothetical protein DL96DRAFT_836143 [Flagelloscypha sp. PMI_526]|nr:hypothetical protein DL96DRAFT_836143 [Flagelloscypha sp. PMI_526]
MSTSKRGRKRNDLLPPNRARDVQRAFRARRAAHLQALEQRVSELEEENGLFRQALNLPPANRPPLGRGPTGNDRPMNHRNSQSKSIQKLFDTTSHEISSPESEDSSVRHGSLSPSIVSPSAQDAASWENAIMFDGDDDVEEPESATSSAFPEPPPQSASLPVKTEEIFASLSSPIPSPSHSPPGLSFNPTSGSHSPSPESLALKSARSSVSYMYEGLGITASSPATSRHPGLYSPTQQHHFVPSPGPADSGAPRYLNPYPPSTSSPVETRGPSSSIPRTTVAIPRHSEYEEAWASNTHLSGGAMSYPEAAIRRQPDPLQATHFSYASPHLTLSRHHVAPTDTMAASSSSLAGALYSPLDSPNRQNNSS